MRPTVHNGRDNQLTSLERRMRELDELSAAAARSLILSAARDRRRPRGNEVHRELARLRAERKRLEHEAELVEGMLPEAEADRHLAAIEEQIREVLAERDEWFRAQLDGRRRRQTDFHQLQRLKEENERLTAELMRCAAALSRDRVAVESPRLRRVWQILRLSGT